MANQTKRKILNIPLPVALYGEVEELAKRQAKTKAEFTREILRRYIEDEKRWRQIRKWGKETAKKFGIKNEKDVNKLIHKFRKEQSQT